MPSKKKKSTKSKSKKRKKEKKTNKSSSKKKIKSQKTSKKSFPINKNLIFSILICQVAGISGSIFTAPAIPTWYQTLTKPSFNPPNWIFAPVWTTLYTLMGISLYLIIKKKKKTKTQKIALGLFALQLAFNILWSYTFFGLKSPYFAFIVIAELIYLVIATILYFYKINKKAAYLLLPYLIWITFASFLNYSIYQLN